MFLEVDVNCDSHSAFCMDVRLYTPCKRYAALAPAETYALYALAHTGTHTQVTVRDTVNHPGHNTALQLQHSYSMDSTMEYMVHAHCGATRTPPVPGPQRICSLPLWTIRPPAPTRTSVEDTSRPQFVSSEDAAAKGREGGACACESFFDMFVFVEHAPPR